MLQFDKLSMNHDGYYVCQACFDKEFLESDEVKLTVSMAGGKEKCMCIRTCVMYMLNKVKVSFSNSKCRALMEKCIIIIYVHALIRQCMMYDV